MRKWGTLLRVEHEIPGANPCALDEAAIDARETKHQAFIQPLHMHAEHAPAPRQSVPENITGARTPN